MPAIGAKAGGAQEIIQHGYNGFLVENGDWVVFPTNGSYPHDEAYFLHFIMRTIHQELKHHPRLESNRFEAWITKRHHQIEAAELVYIAHQLDYAGMLDQG